MTRDAAEAERTRLAEEDPGSTWLIAEDEPGDWTVVRVGLTPADPKGEETLEARPRPPIADDPRTVHDQTLGPWVGPG